MLEFDYMYKDRVCTHVVHDGRNITIDNKIEDKDNFYKAFGGLKEVTPNDLYELFESRCFPRSRVNCEELLQDLGLTEYNPVEIVRRTHGLMYCDYFWIRFKEDGNLSYRDIKIRD